MQQDLRTQIELIKHDLDYLRENDTEFRVPGAEDHKWQLGPTWSEQALQEFEKEYKCQLPEDYRLFLHIVGDGIHGWNNGYSAGPNYGLYALASVAMPSISLPFPFNPKGRMSCFSSNPEWPEECPAIMCRNSSCNFLFLDVESPIWENSHNGLVLISDHGCGWESYLVITGAARGTIWTDLPEGLHTDNETFLQWYRKWLTECMESFRNNL